MLLLISIGITLLVSLTQLFIKKKKARIILTFLSIAAFVVSIFLAVKETRKNDKMEEAAKKNEELLKRAKSQLDKQTGLIENGFTSLEAKIAGEGVNDSNIISILKDLRKNISQFTDSSNTYVANLLGVPKTTTTVSATSEVLQVHPGPAPGPEPDTLKYIYISVGDKAAVDIDANNRFAIYNPTPDKTGRIIVTVNGYRRFYSPGDDYALEPNTRRLVYKGEVNGNFVFYVDEPDK